MRHSGRYDLRQLSRGKVNTRRLSAQVTPSGPSETNPGSPPPEVQEDSPPPDETGTQRENPREPETAESNGLPPLDARMVTRV